MNGVKGLSEGRAQGSTGVHHRSYHDFVSLGSVFLPPPQAVVRTAAAAAKSLQLCPTLCDPIDGSPPGFPV